MVEALEPKTTFTRREYLALEAVAETRHEFLDGRILAIAGAGRTHNLVVTRILQLLANQLEGSPCRPFPSDMRLDRHPGGFIEDRGEPAALVGAPAVLEAGALFTLVDR